MGLFDLASGGINGAPGGGIMPYNANTATPATTWPVGAWARGAMPGLFPPGGITPDGRPLPAPQPQGMAPFINNAQANFGKPNVGPVNGLLPALMAGSGASQATPQGSVPPAVPLPQPRPAMRPTPIAGPMNIVPPGAGGPPPANPAGVGGYNPGLSAVSGAAGGNGGFPPQPAPPMFNPFRRAFASLGQQQPPMQGGFGQPQGILPNLINDIGLIKRLFSGNGGAPKVSDTALY